MASAKALLGSLVGRFVFTHGTVTQVQALSDHFVRLDVEGAALARADFTPGDKVQLFLEGEGLRTYTPVTWSGGRTWFLGYRHDAQGPGARWLAQVKVNDALAFLGPRRSIDVSGEPGQVVVVGDETSLALTAALQASRPDVQAVLETSHEKELEAVATGLQLSGVRTVARGDFAAWLALLRPLVDTGAFVVFTGNALSIQQLKRALAPSRAKAKAYWSPHKRGLD